MDTKKIIEEITNIVKPLADKMTVMIKGMDFWYGHTDLVRKFACEFARLRNADVEIVEISAILHDYARYVDRDKYGKIHAEKGAEFAHDILTNLGYDSEKIDRVCNNILNHDKENQAELNSLEGICLADADGFVHIMNCFEIYNTFRLVKKPKNSKEALQILLNKINSSYDKLSPWCKEYAKEKYDSIVAYITFAINSFSI